MKILALAVPLLIAVAAPSFAQKPHHPSTEGMRQPEQPSQPYRGGGRRDFYGLPY
ncbi:hypothetical protein Cylst_3366 [Cylindrospermum stagnale PCC 7417]|uniref:Uncharacterized protein n=1 Tax=Cylindrospermum stagnale PCC 7417 TaxID=56107 RepID=K9X197_9NOST|nr:hypothetical protein [Cylindrospermum stagnale]AFZ25517.1 hypothetical protein Cylst_3366 [Cylindrospermum stagnale PCC 7417]